MWLFLDFSEKLLALSVKDEILNAKVAKNLSFRAAECEKVNKIITFYVILAVLRYRIEDFCLILPSHSAKSAKTYCSIDSQSPPEKKRAKLSILGLPHLGADFPYLKVACGEPRVVWRRSAPLL